MPNVLLIGGSWNLFKELNSDSRWNVLRALYGESPSRDVLGDPRRWHLIIDDAAHYDGAHEGAPAVISDQYVNEAKAARMIKFATREGDGIASTVETTGHYDLEFSPTSEPEAACLEDFVHEFGQAFERVHLEIEGYRFLQKMQALGGRKPRNPFRPLFVDYYSNPLIALGDFTPPVLYIIDMPDEATRVEAQKYLCNRTVPKLWPDVYSDVFRPRRVVILEREKERLIADRREALARMDEAIEAERRFFASFAPLTQLADDPLKRLVGQALEEVFHCEVTDLDETLDADESKTLDLFVKRGEWKCFVEVRSSGNRGAHKNEIESMDEHLPAMESKYGAANSKLFIFNGLYNRPPEARTDKAMFNQPVIEEAEMRGTTLLSTFQLLDAIEARRNNEITDDEFIEALKNAGVFQPPWSKNESG